MEQRKVTPLHRGARIPEQYRPTIDFDEVERKLRDDRPDLWQQLAEQARAQQAQEDFDGDCRVIGYGLAAAAMFVVIFRLSQLGWLS